MTGEHNEVKLLPCPFCGGEAEVRLHRYQGTGASGMETPEPYAACKSGCVAMKPIPADDWPYGQAHGANTSEQARAIAIAAWNTRPSASPDTALVERVRDYIYDCTKDDCGHGWTLSAEQTRHVIALAALPPAVGEWRNRCEHLLACIDCSNEAGAPPDELDPEDIALIDETRAALNASKGEE